MSRPSIIVKTKNQAELTKDLNLFGKNLKTVIHQVIDVQFEEMVNFAKENAIWVDRTGNARQSIAKEDLSGGEIVSFYLGIGVDYGIWLEVANDGKYAILQPTMDVYEPRILAALEKIGITLKNKGTFTIRMGL